MRRRSRAVLAWVALAVLVAAVPAWSEELKIGAIGTLSGGGTEWGLALQRGVTVAIDEINGAGGVKVGGKTYTLKMVMYDDAYTAQGGTTAATRLVNVDAVKFIIGPVGSPPVLGTVAVTNPAKVVTLSNGYSPKILTPDSKYSFRIQIPTDYFAPSVAAWLRKTYPSLKKVGIISPNDAVGQTLAPLHVQAYNQHKFDVVFDEKYDRGLKDFGPLLTRMMARGAELLELDGNAPGEAGLMVKQARQLGFKGVIIQTGGPGLEEILRVAGSFAEGFLSYDLFNPQDPAVQTYVKGYRAKYEGPIPGISVMYYNAARILHEAFKKANSVDVEKVREALENLEGAPTIFGPVRWTGKERYGINHQLLHSFFISEIKDGKVQVKARVEAGN
ncbi:MAG TPA: ABC transporter substrate-binding protein [Candidatus Deferrimicrobiaceae bacterium]|nr:ABC transporter substrate-binding protein [Candidatus Deferrimicrobiaceae bacterium]